MNNVTASMGVAFTSCTVPAASKLPLKLVLRDGIWGGIHGEPGEKERK